ncbi:MAG: hypothetical protein K9M51_02765 [Candidatus Gracilibacteria bacterium]|nr:hypothetical protein [Candidatus Gracilibacteria bacterium]
MQWDFSRLLNSHYYFDATPGGDFLPGFLLLVFFLLVMFLGSFVKNYARRDKYLKKSIKKKFWMFPFLGVLGIIFVFARFAAVPFFSMRFFLYVTIFLTLGCGVWAFVRTSREYRKRLNSVTREYQKRGK